MKAMILAAGLGTRLRPLTDEKPKALVPVVNKPVIVWNIEYLKSHGVTHMIVNAHHHHRQVMDFLDNGRPFGVEIEVVVEPEILGTGGGIKNTEDFWDDEPFIVINADIITNIPLDQAYAHHLASGALATMVLHDRPPYNKIRLNRDGRIIEIPRQYGTKGLAFTGVHIISPELLEHIRHRGFSDIVDCYRQLIQSGESLNAFPAQGHFWQDIGSPADYLAANRDLAPKAFALGPDTRIHPSSRLKDWAVIGAGCSLEEHSMVQRSVLWEGVTVSAGTMAKDCILTPMHTIPSDSTA